MYILLDSDVIIDVLLKREPFEKDSGVVIDLCVKRKINGFITPIILANIYYFLRKENTHKHVIQQLNQFISTVEILKIDKEVILTALNSDFLDFEDAMQNYAAEFDSKINVIVTRNVKDYTKSKLNVMTPANFIEIYKILHTN